MTNFQIATGEQWTDVMYTYMECSDMWFLTTTYHVGVFLFTNLVLVNLFIAIFLENFVLDEDEKREQQADKFNKRNVPETPELEVLNAQLTKFLSFSKSMAKQAVQKAADRAHITLHMSDEDDLPAVDERLPTSDRLGGGGTNPGFANQNFGLDIKTIF